MIALQTYQEVILEVCANRKRNKFVRCTVSLYLLQTASVPTFVSCKLASNGPCLWEFLCVCVQLKLTRNSGSLCYFHPLSLLYPLGSVCL